MAGFNAMPRHVPRSAAHSNSIAFTDSFEFTLLCPILLSFYFGALRRDIPSDRAHFLRRRGHSCCLSGSKPGVMGMAYAEVGSTNECYGAGTCSHSTFIFTLHREDFRIDTRCPNFILLTLLWSFVGQLVTLSNRACSLTFAIVYFNS